MRDIGSIDTGSPTGGLYGARRSAGTPGLMPQTKIGGLYLTGQAVALPGLMGATAAGFLTVGSIAGFEFIFDLLKEHG